MLLELRNITKRFPVRRSFFGRAREFVHAVNDVTLSIEAGETVGLVGESGCGKTTLGRIALGLIRPTSGEVIFNGDVRQAVFQDPFSSLNPRMSAADIITEPILIHKAVSKKERMNTAEELLESVGLEAAHAHRYPHEFSGGQRQRIGIARAIALKPEFIVADEPVSSLDVAVQAEILELLRRLKKGHGISYLFVSHDLRVVASMCERVAVMYLGKIVELLPASGIKEPLHPYTRALISAVPVADPAAKKKRMILEGDVPSPVRLPQACLFHPRCPYKEDICMKAEPVLERRKNGHLAACHLAEKVRGK
jgi:oligopeptide/dipeptide ABC transporter ATP-binding protein